LPGVSNPEEAISTLRGAGQLEFIDSQGQFIPQGQTVRTSTNPNPPAPKPTQPVTATNELTPTQPLTSTVSGPIYPSITSGRELDTSQVAPRFGGTQSVGRNQYAVTFAFTGDSASKLAQFSSQNVGKPMCIVLDNVVQSCPVIQNPLVNGSGEITTQTQQEAQNIYTQLKYGALPVSFDVESNRTVSATLGQDSVAVSITAGIVGLVVVALFMILYYRLPGVVATIALLIYTAITFAFYRLIPITLTLPGIAGFILSIGLAVDANVLIFARLKEELRRGKSLRGAVEAGFDEAWPAIRDSNASTLITSTILFLFGNTFGVSIIKGFAITLALGIIISLFTAITVTRTLLRLIVPLPLAQNPWMFELDEAPGLQREREALA
jgi:preprotein translocase subunit SecD